MKILKKLDFLKNEALRRDLRRFYGFVRPYRFRAIVAIVLTAMVGTMGGGIAYLVRVFADDLFSPGGSSSSLTKVFGQSALVPLLIIAYSVVESLLSFGSEYFTVWVSKRVGNDLKMGLFDKLMHAEPQLFDTASVGDVLVRYSGDADIASATLLNNVKTIVTRLVTSVVSIGFIFWQSWIMALVTVLPLCATLIPLSLVQRRLKQYIRDMVKSGAEASTNYIEAYHGNRVVTSYNLYDYVEERLRRTLKDIFRLSIKKVQRTNALSLVMHLATAGGLAMAFWLQRYLIRSGDVTPGEFLACLAAMFTLYTPIKKIGSSLDTIQNSVMAIQRLLEVLDRKSKIESKPDAVKLDGFRRAVTFEKVNFSYVPDKPVLRDINLEVPFGQSVALVGNSGGGKTSLVNLVPRFYDIESGAVRLDGIDVRDVELASLRDLVAVVFQDNFLFAGTIRENIMLGKRDATPEQLDAAIRAACLEEFITGLEAGLDTEVGERGTMLSGGQKQRVAIARAFLKDAPIVILDEATSALDTKSELVVQQAIENLMRNKTVFIIAHRLSTVINADRIVVIRDGRIVETGTHRELMEREDGMYASLYRTQLA